MNRPRFPLKPGYDNQPICDLSQPFPEHTLVKVYRRVDEVQELALKYSTPHLNVNVNVKKTKKQRRKVLLELGDVDKSPPPEKSSPTIDTLQELFVEKVRFMERLTSFNDCDINSTFVKAKEFVGDDAATTPEHKSVNNSDGDGASTTPAHEPVGKNHGLLNPIESRGQLEKRTKYVEARRVTITEPTRPVKVNATGEFCDHPSANKKEDINKGFNQSLKKTELSCTGNYKASNKKYVKSQTFYNKQFFKFYFVENKE